MKRITLALFAMLATLGLSAGAATAATSLPTAVVSQDSFNATLNVLTPCGTQSTDNNYQVPVTPAGVVAAVKADTAADPGNYADSYGFTRWSGDFVTANGLPMTIFVKNITRTYNVGGTLQTVSGIGHAWHAFVPGYRGTSCSVWTEVEARDF